MTSSWLFLKLNLSELISGLSYVLLFYLLFFYSTLMALSLCLFLSFALILASYLTALSPYLSLIFISFGYPFKAMFL